MLEKCPDLRSAERRRALWAVLRDAYEEVGIKIVWENNIPWGRGWGFRVTKTEIATGKVLDSMTCDSDTVLIRQVYRARPRNTR